MRSKQQQMKVRKQRIAQAEKTLTLAMRTASRSAAHARKLYDEGLDCRYTQTIAAQDYMYVRLCRNTLQREIDGGLFYSYAELGL